MNAILDYILLLALAAFGLFLAGKLFGMSMLAVLS
jgi:hypothetical protein